MCLRATDRLTRTSHQTPRQTVQCYRFPDIMMSEDDQASAVENSGLENDGPDSDADKNRTGRRAFWSRRLFARSCLFIPVPLFVTAFSALSPARPCIGYTPAVLWHRYDGLTASFSLLSPSLSLSLCCLPLCAAADKVGRVEGCVRRRLRPQLLLGPTRSPCSKQPRVALASQPVSQLSRLTDRRTASLALIPHRRRLTV